MFSELVDICVQRSGRPNHQPDIIAYATQTVRQMQTKNYFKKNLIEDQIIATADPYTWIPPERIQKIKAVRYSNGDYPVYYLPGAKQKETLSFYYGAAGYYVFKGMSSGFQQAGVSQQNTIDIAYYQFTKKLKYYAVAARPAVYDYETETYTYADFSGDGGTNWNDPANQETARNLIGNWILKDWNELVQEGTLAKIFKLIDNTTRASTHFAFFQREYVESFLGTEIGESVNQ
jgi:hypothetical protein